MKLEEVAALYKGCATYEAQYLPTFKKILHHINSDDVRDIVTKYEEYKAIVPGIDSDAKKKHIRSLRQKLQIENTDTKTIIIKDDETPKSDNTSTDASDSHEEDEEEATDGEGEGGEEDVDDEMKSNKYRAYFNMTVKYMHLLPPEVITQVCRLGFSD